MFFVFLLILVIGWVGIIWNISNITKSFYFSKDGGMNLLSRHIIFMSIVAVGGIGSLVTGIIWIVQQFTQ